MACVLKYDGIIFRDKNELFEYISNGTKPETNTSIQEVKNDIIKNALTSSDINTGIDAIINVSEITDQQRALLSDSFGVDTAQAYIDYVETGNISAANKNAVRPIFQDISTNIKDIVSSIEYANSQQGSKPIEISHGILEFTNKIKINDSQRFIPTTSGSEGASSAGVLSTQKEKWFNPRSEEGAQGTTGEIQAVQEPGAGNINREAGGNNIVNGEQQRSVRDSQDSTASEINTARDSGVNSDGNPRRIQLATGEYVSWDSDTREWTNIVRNVSGDRWGTVRPASQRERAAAADERSNRIITGQSYPDVAINLIFGQGDPINNLAALKGMGYINLNPTELYDKLKTQFNNNSIGIDQIASAIGTDMYPSLFSIVGENAINNMDNKIVLENLNVAKEMEASGLDPQRIKTATGWERGIDKKWRYELKPVAAIDPDLFIDIIYRTGNETYNYGDLFSGLETAYPNINKLKIVFDDTNNFRTEGGETNGIYDSKTNTITLYKKGIKKNKIRKAEINNDANSRSNAYSVLKRLVNHEIQHFIQNEENFLKGSYFQTARRQKQILYRFPILLELKNNPNIDTNYLSTKYNIDRDLIEYIKDNPEQHNFDTFQAEYDNIITKDLVNTLSETDVYINNTGEVEARNSETRMFMPIDNRRMTLLEETEDVPRGNQVIINTLNKKYDSIDGTGREEASGIRIPFNSSLANYNQRRSRQFNKLLLREQRSRKKRLLQSDARIREEIYPSNLENSKGFFSNLGFAPAQTELLTFIHGLIPDAYNKTNTAIKIAMELMYPEQTGFNIMNMLPYTKEEMYDIMTKYQNENISNNLGDVFIHEYVNNEMSFGMTRNKEVLDTIINKAKSLQIELPQQYENYFQATNKFKTFFTKGQKLRNKEDVLYVHDINYSNPEDITYVLWHPQEDAYYEMDMLKMDLFSEDTESDFENMEDNAVAVINALEQIGTMVRFMPKQKDPGIYNIFNNEIYLDSRKLNNRLLYHEAAHAIFIKGIRLNKDNVTKLHTDIANVLRNGTPQERALAGRLDFFVQKYNEEEAQAAGMPLNELRAHEFLAELVAQLAANNQSITSQSEKSIIDKIIEFFRNIFGYNQNLDINNIDDVIEMINGIANKLRTGETINFSDYESMMSDENLNQGVLYARGDIYTGDARKVITPGKKYRVMMPDGKGTNVTVTLSGTNNDGDGFVEFEFSDGKTERYLTQHLVLTEIFDDMYSIKLLPAASQKANPTHAGNVLSDSDKQMLKEFALEQKADGTYEYSINEIHSLIKDDVQVDYNVFVDLINGFREEQALAAAKNADPISDEVYQDFKENNSVSQDVLESIADKIAKNKKLSKREQEIKDLRINDINRIIDDYINTPPPTEPVAPNSDREEEFINYLVDAINSFEVTPEVAEIIQKGTPPEEIVARYDSGKTIARKTGEEPENAQAIIRLSFKNGFDFMREVLGKSKDFFGVENVHDKVTMIMYNKRTNPLGTQMMNIVISQDLALTVDRDESSRAAVRAIRRKLNRFMQSGARQAALTMGANRYANMNPENLFLSSSKGIEVVLTPDAKEAREIIIKALEQEETSEAYLDFAQRREEAIRNASNPATSQKREKKEKTTNSTKRSKSDRSRWVPRGGDFIEQTINNIKDFITKKC